MYTDYSRENPRTRIIVCISVIIPFAFPPLPLSASYLFLSVFYYTLPFPFTPSSYFSFLFFSSLSFYPTHFPSLRSPSPTPSSLSLPPSMSSPTHLYTHKYILTFHSSQYLQPALSGDLAQTNVLLLVVPSSFVSQSSQKWHSQDLRT